MGIRSSALASIFLTGRLFSIGLAVLQPASILAGQIVRTPEALLEEAESLHRDGKLDKAIEDYRLFLAQYPDVFQVRSDLGAALAGGRSHRKTDPGGQPGLEVA